MPFNKVERLPPRDRDVIFLAVCFFWLKYYRRSSQQPGFEPTLPEPYPSDPPFLQILKAAFDLKRQQDADSEGDAVGGAAGLITNHPLRPKLVGVLTDTEVRGVCSSLDAIFENQEFCAWCESWSYYDDTDPQEFALSVATEMLWLCGGQARLPWFQGIFLYKVRRQVVESVVAHRASEIGGLRGLLTAGETN